ncbi:MAG: hypothetical protein ACI8W7_003589, partial [Gammaproteobacteria bacterium]
TAKDGGRIQQSILPPRALLARRSNTLVVAYFILTRALRVATMYSIKHPPFDLLCSFTQHVRLADGVNATQSELYPLGTLQTLHTASELNRQ